MSQTEITAYANRGTRYAVTYKDGHPYIVCVVYRKAGHKLGNLIERQLWQEGDPKMSLTVACAIRSADRVIRERFERTERD